MVDDVFAAVEDWDAMRERGRRARRAGCEERPPPHADPADVAEAATYLAWLADDHFTFVAAAEVDVDGDVVPGSELGVARRRALFREHEPADPTDGWLLTLTKALQHSTVHRAVPLDCVDVRRFGADGTAVGETRFLGLYTANVYSQSTEAIPLLRRKVAQVHRRGRASRLRATTGARSPTCSRPTRATSCSGSTLGELAELALGIVAMGQRRRVRLFVSRDQSGCFVSCLVYLPRDRYTTIARIQVVDALRRAFGGSDVDFTVLVTESVMARLHVVVSTPDGARAVDALALEAELAALVRAWVDDLHDAFVDARGEEAGLDVVPALDATRSLPRTSSRSTPTLRSPTSPCSRRWIPAATSRSGSSRPSAAWRAIKLYRTGGALVLSDVMPLLEHLGVTVVDERPYEIDAPDGIARWIYSFGVRADGGRSARRSRRCRRASPTSSSGCGRARSRTTS